MSKLGLPTACEIIFASLYPGLSRATMDGYRFWRKWYGLNEALSTRMAQCAWRSTRRSRPKRLSSRTYTNNSHSETLRPSVIPTFQPSDNPISFCFTLLRTLLRPQKTQLISFQAIPNSFGKIPGYGGDVVASLQTGAFSEKFQWRETRV